MCFLYAEDNRLFLACKFGYTSLVRYLINKCNVDVSSKLVSLCTVNDSTIIIQPNHCIQYKYIAFGLIIIALLVVYIRDTVIIIGAETSDGLTPLGVAVREGHLDTVKYLILECSLNVNGTCNIQVWGFHNDNVGLVFNLQWVLETNSCVVVPCKSVPSHYTVAFSLGVMQS